MPELQRLRMDHEVALLTFEQDNRAYFAASISDRGDEFYEHFSDRHAEMLAEQESGECAYYVLVADDGSILGRFNLRDVDPVAGTALLGYRVAETTAGRGVTTATVTQIGRDVAPALGVRTLRAATTDANTASRRVLDKAGFTLVGVAGPDELGGRPGHWYEWRLDPD